MGLLICLVIRSDHCRFVMDGRRGSRNTRAVVGGVQDGDMHL